MEEKRQIARARTLTDADMIALAELLKNQHSCRFENVTVEDMDFMKDLLKIYKETRSEVIKWVVKGIMYGMMILVLVVAYFKFGKH